MRAGQSIKILICSQRLVKQFLNPIYRNLTGYDRNQKYISKIFPNSNKFTLSPKYFFSIFYRFKVGNSTMNALKSNNHHYFPLLDSSIFDTINV